MEKGTQRVGLIGLILIVVGSMVGSGVFNISQGMASNAGVGATMIAWLITGIGVFFIAKVFQTLSNEKSDLEGGIYYYAKDGFGKYVGFNSAWGYWVSNLIGNVSFAVLLVNSLTTFFPNLNGTKSIASLVLCSILIWTVIAFIAKGMKTANILNSIATVAKVVPIGLALFLMFLAFDSNIFTADIWAKAFNASGGNVGQVGDQIKNAMLQTLWVFVGIEGAVVISGRAKKKSDVGKATIIAYISVIICYILLVLLSFGVMDQRSLASVNTPALAGILKHTNGQWAETFINIGIIVSILGSWVSWTILTVETPMIVAKDKMFPSFLGKLNKNNAAINALIFSGIVMEIAYVFIAMKSENAFQSVTNTATTMILVPYILSSAYLVKISIKSKKKINMLYGVGGVIYAGYMLSTAGIPALLGCMGLYGIGIVFLIIRAKENKMKIFEKKWELVIASGLILGGIMGILG